MFHSVQRTLVIYGHFYFHWKRFSFSIYTTISARYGGIKSQYALFKFFAEYHFGFILFVFGLLLFYICVFSFPHTMCDLTKSKIYRKKVHFLGKLTEI
jgi:hypothetical protein